MRFFISGIRLVAMIFFLTGCGGDTLSLNESKHEQLTIPDGKVVFEISTLPSEMIQITPTSNIQFNSDGSITTGVSDRVPHTYEGVKRWGMFETKPIQSPQEFTNAVVNVDETVSDTKDLVMVEVATSDDGSNWSGYTKFGRGANEITFLQPETYIKYRFTILSYSNQPPVIKKIGVQLKNHR